MYDEAPGCLSQAYAVLLRASAVLVRRNSETRVWDVESSILFVPVGIFDCAFEFIIGWGTA